ncbi:heterokaryon incompatibility protein-domain-containing protein [Diaporthe sp. PMI_573]|nr:heterokaryon incompatibility protein-domain-containing protein [Diaporthaceae sp. PMI_573]
MQVAGQFTYPHRVIPWRDGQPLAFYFERQYRAPVYSQDFGNLVQRGGATMRVKLRPPPSPIPYGTATDFVLCPIFSHDGVPEAQDSARFVLEDRIDLAVCREWLRDCESQHLGDCVSPGLGVAAVLPAEMRVIDVVQGCIIPTPSNCRYLALSYVWGQVPTFSLRRENFKNLETPGALWEYRSTTPKTISDAIQVTQRLGERYLWVDSLCIIQDSTQKSSQVLGMGNIYGAAVLTLVAAQGDHANAGLIGLETGTRELKQITQEVWPDLILTASIDSPGHPADSVWASRGWTCQEQVISKRLLLFMHGQVMWQCPTCYLCEDTAAFNKVEPPERLHQLPTKKQDPPSLRPTSIHSLKPLLRPQAFSHYASIINDYSKRRFTFEDDILLAFEGFGSVLHQSFRSPPLAGLPQAYFDQSILWMPSHIQRRREGTGKIFPSWSWAGWVGQVRYEDLDESNVEAVVSCIKWYSGNGGRANNESGFQPINGTGIGIAESSFGVPRSLNTFFWVPLFELLSGSPTSLPRVADLSRLPNQLLLQFWTSSTFLDVSVRDSPTFLDQFEASRHRPVKLHVYLPREYGRQLAGYLVLNGSGPLRTDPSRHEFIVISEAQVSGFNPVNWACKYSELCRMYNVMLVEWDRDHKIAYRVAIGRVLKAAWVGSRPVRKLITLG